MSRFAISCYKPNAPTNMVIVEVVWFGELVTQHWSCVSCAYACAAFLALLTIVCASIATASYITNYVNIIFTTPGIGSCAAIPTSTLCLSSRASHLIIDVFSQDRSLGGSAFRNICNDNVGIIIVGFLLFGLGASQPTRILYFATASLTASMFSGGVHRHSRGEHPP